MGEGLIGNRPELVVPLRHGVISTRKLAWNARDARRCALNISLVCTECNMVAGSVTWLFRGATEFQDEESWKEFLEGMGEDTLPSGTDRGTRRRGRDSRTKRRSRRFSSNRHRPASFSPLPLPPFPSCCFFFFTLRTFDSSRFSPFSSVGLYFLPRPH